MRGTSLMLSDLVLEDVVVDRQTRSTCRRGSPPTGSADAHDRSALDLLFGARTGLIALPTSCAATYFRIFTEPVERVDLELGDVSAHADALPGRLVDVAPRPMIGFWAAPTTSVIVSFLVGSALTKTVPLALASMSRSSALTLSLRAATASTWLRASDRRFVGAPAATQRLAASQRCCRCRRCSPCRRRLRCRPARVGCRVPLTRSWP